MCDALWEHTEFSITEWGRSGKWKAVLWHLLTSQGPKQVTWPSPKSRVGKHHSSLVAGPTKSHCTGRGHWQGEERQPFMQSTTVAFQGGSNKLLKQKSRRRRIRCTGSLNHIWTCTAAWVLRFHTSEAVRGNMRAAQKSTLRSPQLRYHQPRSDSYTNRSLIQHAESYRLTADITLLSRLDFGV